MRSFAKYLVNEAARVPGKTMRSLSAQTNCHMLVDNWGHKRQPWLIPRRSRPERGSENIHQIYVGYALVQRGGKSKAKQTRETKRKYSSYYNGLGLHVCD